MRYDIQPYSQLNESYTSSWHSSHILLETSASGRQVIRAPRLNQTNPAGSFSGLSNTHEQWDSFTPFGMDYSLPRDTPSLGQLPLLGIQRPSPKASLLLHYQIQTMDCCSRINVVFCFHLSQLSVPTQSLCSTGNESTMLLMLAT